MIMLYFISFDSPFFGEDVHFEVPRDFQTLSFYLFDTDLIGKDTVLGKVGRQWMLMLNFQSLFPGHVVLNDCLHLRTSGNFR